MFPYLLLAALCACGSRAAEVPRYTLNDGHQIPAVALGTWLGNDTQGRIRPQKDEVTSAVRWAAAAGGRHVDTAYAYGTEPQVGAALAALLREGARREDFFITTKLWNTAHHQTSVLPALRRSLHQLGLDRVDLYLIHWPIAQYGSGNYYSADFVETWRGMAEVRRLGLASSVGVSNFNQQQLDRLMQEGPVPAVLQVEINLTLQQPELLAYCRAHNITVMGHSPFGSLLAHKARGDAPPPRLDDPKLQAVAAKYNKTVAQLVLRYIMELGVIPVPKSLTKERVEQNIDIFDFQLTEEDKTLLRSYDRGYRTLPQIKWRDHPDYPFEKYEEDIDHKIHYSNN